jgi:hypothetical protein
MGMFPASKGRVARIVSLSALVAAGLLQACASAGGAAANDGSPPSALAQATTRGVAAFRDVCLSGIGRPEALRTAAKGAGFVPIQRPSASERVWPNGEGWASQNGGFPLLLLMSDSGYECVTILRKADPGLVFGLAFVLPLSFRAPNVEVSASKEADQPNREVIAFRVRNLPPTAGLAERLIIMEPDFARGAAANLVLTVRLVRGSAG